MGYQERGAGDRPPLRPRCRGPASAVARSFARPPARRTAEARRRGRPRARRRPPWRRRCRRRAAARGVACGPSPSRRASVLPPCPRRAASPPASLRPTCSPARCASSRGRVRARRATAPRAGPARSDRGRLRAAPEPIEETAAAIRRAGRSRRGRGDGHPRRGGRGRDVRPPRRAARKGGRARQQRRRPVPEPGRGDHPEGLSHGHRAQRPGYLADDPRRRDQGVHPAGRRQGPAA